MGPFPANGPFPAAKGGLATEFGGLKLFSAALSRIKIVRLVVTGIFLDPLGLAGVYVLDLSPRIEVRG